MKNFRLDYRYQTTIIFVFNFFFKVNKKPISYSQKLEIQVIVFMIMLTRFFGEDFQSNALHWSYLCAHVSVVRQQVFFLYKFAIRLILKLKVILKLWKSLDKKFILHKLHVEFNT